MILYTKQVKNILKLYNLKKLLLLKKKFNLFYNYKKWKMLKWIIYKILKATYKMYSLNQNYYHKRNFKEFNPKLKLDPIEVYMTSL